MASKLYNLEIITAKDKKTNTEYQWIYEGQDLFSKCFKNNELISGEELEQQLVKALFMENENHEHKLSLRWNITGVSKDGIEYRIVLDSYKDEIELCSANTFFV